METLLEFAETARREKDMDLRFVVCEDGSTDDTVAVLKRASKELPLTLLTSKRRKGYSQAVIDGLNACGAPLIACADSDGQCDPGALAKLVGRISECDVALGQRIPRIDPWSRKLMSFLFRCVFRILFKIDLKDPSSPYLLMRRDVWSRLEASDIGILPQGFWWEFVARITKEKCRIACVIVSHRRRAGGTTRVYKPWLLPRIAVEHLFGLLRLKRSLAEK